ncbi:hypothetical protein PHLCEN_2v11246 [Hermanssonia centrifuga]|uniref:Uncharacterized protein n=1 Tax=Hermanssonia centrifuga TaxID=98765 RepID=A0A2R6NKH3_9APHY|nr:hypothetical protein PHLCEN_2v11246 [Hermanssonia centrifuga]
MVQAREKIKYFSSRDRLEMCRIARLAPDDAVFQGHMPWTPHYHNLWREWLETKGPDIAIVFV